MVPGSWIRGRGLRLHRGELCSCFDIRPTVNGKSDDCLGDGELESV